MNNEINIIIDSCPIRNDINFTNFYLINKNQIINKFNHAFIPANDIKMNFQSLLNENCKDNYFDEKKGLKYLNEFKEKYNRKYINLNIAFDEFYPNKEILMEIKKILYDYKIFFNIIKDDYYLPNPKNYDGKIVLSFIPYYDDIANYEMLGLLFLERKFKKEYIKLIDNYKSEKNIKNRENIIVRLNKIIFETVNIIPLFKMYNFYLMNHNVKNLMYGEDFYFDHLYKEN